MVIQRGLQIARVQTQLVAGAFGNGLRHLATADQGVAGQQAANALVGGSNKSIALQPLSIQGQVGLNLAIGVTQLELVKR